MPYATKWWNEGLEHLDFYIHSLHIYFFFSLIPCRWGYITSSFPPVYTVSPSLLHFCHFFHSLLFTRSFSDLYSHSTFTLMLVLLLLPSSSFFHVLFVNRYDYKIMIICFCSSQRHASADFPTRRQRRASGANSRRNSDLSRRQRHRSEPCKGLSQHL